LKQNYANNKRETTMPVRTRHFKKMDIMNNDDPKSEIENIEVNEILYTKENENILLSILKTVGRYSYMIIKFLMKISGVYLFWILLHYGASHLYIQFCVPSNFFGFLISPFMTASPHCQGLRWIIYTGANTINNMWVILGTWLCSYLLNLKTNNDDIA